MALSRKYFNYVTNKYRDVNGDKLLAAIDDNIVSPPVELLLVKGYPLLSRINSIILHIIQAGLINYWSKLTNNIRINVRSPDSDLLSIIIFFIYFTAL